MKIKLWQRKQRDNMAVIDRLTFKHTISVVLVSVIACYGWLAYFDLKKSLEYRKTSAELAAEYKINNLLDNKIEPYRIGGAKNVMIHFSHSSYGNSVLISRWHTTERGWRKIGYHFVVLNGRITKHYTDLHYDGIIETGRGLNERGVHCTGHNDAIGICLVSSSGLITKKQYESLKKILINLSAKYNNINLYQHANFNRRKPRLKVSI